MFRYGWVFQNSPKDIIGIRYLTPETLAYIFEYTFSNITDKNRVIEKLYLLASHKSNLLRAGAASVIGDKFLNIPDKQKILGILHELTFDKNSDVLYFVIISLKDIYQYIPDNYINKAREDLHRLVYNDKEFIREETAFAFSRIAEYYKLKRDFKSVYECYHNSSLAYRKKFFESNLKLKRIFYLYNSMSFYYLGRSLMDHFIALPYDPKESKVILKKAVKCFKYAVENVNIYDKTPTPTEIYRDISTQTETRFYPICHGIYSIYLDYFSIRLDIGKKKINLTKIKEKISKVKEQCRLLDTEKGKSNVDLFDKFVSALGAIIEAYDLKSKGFDASLGEKASIEYQIEKKEIKVKELLTQINEALDNLETPILKEIGKEEKNIIEKLTLRLKVETEFSFWDRVLNKHGIAATLAAFFVAVIYGVTRYNSDPLMFYAVVAGILLYLIVIYLFKKK